MQRGDVYLYQTTDGGEINVDRGLFEMRPGLESVVYLALFGGNEDDPGGSDTSLQWWGNIGEEEPAKQYRSETQHLLQALSATGANLRRLEDAVTADLGPLVDAGVLTAVEVSARIPAVNRVEIILDLTGDGTSAKLTYSENWKARI